MSISEEITKRIIAAGGSFVANDNISQYLSPGDKEKIRDDVEEAVNRLMSALVIDTRNDPNTQETAHRIARMFVDDVFAGRYDPMPRATVFPNTKRLNDILMVKTTIRSTCSHHFAPIIGTAWIGVIPDKKVIGISKFNRIANWICSRPQIQEECGVQIADMFEKLIEPKGLAVVIKASHTCMIWRGVKDSQARMTTSIMRGIFKEDFRARSEFMAMVQEREAA